MEEIYFSNFQIESRSLRAAQGSTFGGSLVIGLLGACAGQAFIKAGPARTRETRYTSKLALIKISVSS